MAAAVQESLLVNLILQFHKVDAKLPCPLSMPLLINRFSRFEASDEDQPQKLDQSFFVSAYHQSDIMPSERCTCKFVERGRNPVIGLMDWLESHAH